MKQRKCTQDGWAVLLDIHKHFLCTDRVTRQATDAEQKLQISHYNSEMKRWDWDKYVALHKELHVIMENYGYGEIGTKVHHFLKGIKSTELEAVVNVVWAQPEKNGTDFDTPVSYLEQVVMKKGPSMQSIHTARTKSQPVKPKVAAFMGKVECKNYPKAVWNS